MSPFDRAVAGLALGSEEFIGRVRRWASKLRNTGEQPALAALEREGKASPERVEAVVKEVFLEARPTRMRRLLLYAQRVHSGLGPVEIGRRYGRSHTAVRLAVRALQAAAARDATLAAGLREVARKLE